MYMLVAVTLKSSRYSLFSQSKYACKTDFKPSYTNISQLPNKTNICFSIELRTNSRHRYQCAKWASGAWV